MAAASTIRTVGSDTMASWILDAQVAFESTSTTILNHSDQIRREYSSLRDECNKMTRHRARLSEALVYNDTELDEMRLRTIRNVGGEWGSLLDQSLGGMANSTGGVNKSRPPGGGSLSLVVAS